ncbi:MAG: tRNA (N(6)-L-threonylcarbamoyladenosine(37)-C(2))-methylthiotransferase MtaB [Deltaproteobacteria bacterium]|nr:tRNA (N(6)-L-threonylcarbamoyladenosine(37)-C(2))-methylthiotransferase MtaB [Deltaproteobacteria bacterium]
MSGRSAAMKVALTTLGCKVNQYESAALREALEARGHRMVPFGDIADCCIVNTCTVTSRADFQSRQLIRRANRSNPAAAVIVTGCCAQVSPDGIAGLPGVAAVVGNEEKSMIPEIISGAGNGECRVLVGDILRIGRFSPFYAGRFADHTRAFLKIQDGCNAFCSYCIVPYARGPSRSLPEAEVKRQIAILGRNGYREIVLTGIHLGVYGQDLDPRTDLLGILKWVEKERPVERLRLSSLEPTEVSDELIALMAGTKVLCQHFHIPLQSGDDRILRLMNRHYDRAYFQERMAKIRAVLPDASIGIDVLTGFPGESEREFDNTRSFIEEIPATYLHVFPYSNRPGTPASELPGQVRSEEKKRRAALLREIGKRKHRIFLERFLGRPLSVLVEAKEEGGGRGFTENYLPVSIDGGAGLGDNGIYRILADRYEGKRLVGRIVHHG